MFARLLAATCLTAVLLLVHARDGLATREAPPPAHTGGFGEPDCAMCHMDAKPNAGTGRLALDGVPEHFTPGASYVLTLTLTQAKMTAAGFQMTARFEDGTQAGRLSIVPADSARTGVMTEPGGVQYGHHSGEPGVATSENLTRWSMRWTAPTRTGAVIFHVAANAGNDDYTPFGDFVYTLSRRTTPTGTTGPM